MPRGAVSYKISVKQTYKERKEWWIPSVYFLVIFTFPKSEVTTNFVLALHGARLQHMVKHVVNTHAYSPTHHGSCKLKLKLFMNAKK